MGTFFDRHLIEVVRFEMVDAVGIEPTTCRLRVAGQPISALDCGCLWSAPNPVFIRVPCSLPLLPITAVVCLGSPVFSPVSFGGVYRANPPQSGRRHRLGSGRTGTTCEPFPVNGLPLSHADAANYPARQSGLIGKSCPDPRGVRASDVLRRSRGF